MKKTINHKAWFFVLPALSLLVVVGIIPLITVVNTSFHDIITPEFKVWVGVEWYREIIRSASFQASFARSLVFSSIILMIEIPLGIAIALSMPKRGIWVPVCLVSMSLPLLVPWNIIPIMWKTLVHYDLGILGQAFVMAGIDFNWKGNWLDTWTLIVLMDVWHWTSLVVLLCYSSLTTIPSAYYQAAAIDGASRWSVFRYIELPKMKSVLMMALLLRFMDSFMIFTEAFGINAGGPINTTTFLAMDLGEEIFAFNYGPSAARSVIYFIIILSVSWAFHTVLNRHKPLHQADGKENREKS